MTETYQMSSTRLHVQAECGPVQRLVQHSALEKCQLSSTENARPREQQGIDRDWEVKPDHKDTGSCGKRLHFILEALEMHEEF